MIFNLPGKLFEISDKVPLFFIFSFPEILSEILAKIPGILSEFLEFLENYLNQLKKLIYSGSFI